MSAIAFELLGEIFAPLETLLASGGDTRLQIDPSTRLNGYGCRPYPRPEAFTFASSTATSISGRAYAAAEAARCDLIRQGLRFGLERAFDDRVETLRRDLVSLLDLDDVDPAIVFSPSGTDSELHALLVARTALGTPMISVIAASDETGSGVAYAACGRHFNSLTAQGVSVVQGNAILGLAEGVECVGVPSRDAQGARRSPSDIDEAVILAVSQAVASGAKVLLHVMDHSKLGRRCPSLECLRKIEATWGKDVQIVVDACQLRLSRSHLRWHLDHGHMVMITGSKFFTGPPFSGALLVPPALGATMTGVSSAPEGLCDYTNRSDWPQSWHALRQTLRETMNLGQLLRWIAAAEEMRAYYLVPASFRKLAFAQFAAVVPRLIAGEGALRLLTEEGARSTTVEPVDDAEMSVRTIFPFLVRRAGRWLAVDDCALLYHALNQDISALLPASSPDRERRLAAQLCHIGQPVRVHAPDGSISAALRISAGARVVSETWSNSGDAASLRNLEGEFDQVRTILDKINLVLSHFEAVTAAAASRKDAATRPVSNRRSTG